MHIKEVTLKTFLIIVSYFLIFILLNTKSFAACGFDSENNPITCDANSINDALSRGEKGLDWSQINQELVKPENIPKIPPDKVDVTKVQDQSKLTKDQLYFKDSSGSPNINKISDWNNLDKNAKDGALSEITKKSIVTEGVTGGKVVGNGLEFEGIKFWKIDKTSINNCIKCSYDGSKLKFQHADSVVADKSASTNIDNFDGYEGIFSIEKADSFLSDCIRVDDIKDSEFKVTDKVEITTKSNVDLKITDCSYNEVIFSGKGKLIIDKSENPTYVIENGSLKMKGKGYIGNHIAIDGEAAIYIASSSGYYIYKVGNKFFVVSVDNPSIAFEVKERILPDSIAYYSKEDDSFLIIVPSDTIEVLKKSKVKSIAILKIEEEYNETVEANNSIIIETDKVFGFKCLTINPVGSYFYNDKDLRKDFVINVPKESPTYKLCLRKNIAQQFKDYNGLVDFVNGKIELNGIVNYLRYPLKNNQIASLLSDFVYRGLKNVRTLLAYDTDLLFLNNAAIKNILENKNQITFTKPNNHITIKELELEDGKIHRIAELNKITKNQLNQDVISNYESDSLLPKIAITNGILVQDNGKNRITIYPPQK